VKPALIIIGAQKSSSTMGISIIAEALSNSKNTQIIIHY